MPSPLRSEYGGVSEYSYFGSRALAFGDTKTVPMMLDQFYIGYGLTPVGSLIGLGYGFICGTICGAVLAWLYNLLADRIGAAPQG